MANAEKCVTAFEVSLTEHPEICGAELMLGKRWANVTYINVPSVLPRKQECKCNDVNKH